MVVCYREREAEHGGRCHHGRGEARASGIGAGQNHRWASDLSPLVSGNRAIAVGTATRKSDGGVHGNRSIQSGIGDRRRIRLGAHRNTDAVLADGALVVGHRQLETERSIDARARGNEAGRGLVCIGDDDRRARGLGPLVGVDRTIAVSTAARENHRACCVHGLIGTGVGDWQIIARATYRRATIHERQRRGLNAVVIGIGTHGLARDDLIGLVTVVEAIRKAGDCHRLRATPVGCRECELRRRNTRFAGLGHGKPYCHVGLRRTHQRRREGGGTARLGGREGRGRRQGDPAAWLRHRDQEGARCVTRGGSVAIHRLYVDVIRSRRERRDIPGVAADIARRILRDAVGDERAVLALIIAVVIKRDGRGVFGVVNLPIY